MKPVRMRSKGSNQLFAGNPMMAEVNRNIRRLAGFHLSPGARKAALISLGTLYTFFLLLIAIYGDPAIPVAVLFIQTFAFCLIIPSVTHNAIVGEKERRSWDMLLVAPVTPLQIIVAKFMTGATTVALVTAAAVPAIALGTLKPGHSLGSLLLGEALSVSFGLSLNAFALAVSSRSKRSLHAQMAIYGTAAGTLLLWPLIVGILAPADSALQALLNCLNPFFIILGGPTPMTLNTGWQAGFYLMTTFVFLWAAHRSVVRNMNQESE